ncbi:hypothetical protein [Sphingomonas sp. Mn802worker]|nr:hypothetical protein [Sphingomonas sp. Mn802worker]
MRQPPRDLVLNDLSSRMPSGAGFAVAVVLVAPLYALAALLI